jgi:hypothetical protein
LIVPHAEREEYTWSIDLTLLARSNQPGFLFPASRA